MVNIFSHITFGEKTDISKFHLLLLYTLYSILNATETRNLGSIYPVTLTLSNNDILLITRDEIIFYDSSFNEIKKYELEDDEKANNINSNYKTTACQYSEEYRNYILVFSNDYLFVFDENGEKLCKNNLSEELKNYSYYDLTPYKKVENELFYIISSSTQIKPFQLNISYYKINNENCGNFLILRKIYSQTLIPNYKEISISKNVICQIMNSNIKNNILSCFYGLSYPNNIFVSSFDLENNLEELTEYSTYIEYSVNVYFIKAISVEDKSKAFIAFFYTSNSGNTLIYDINKNELSTPIVRSTQVGSKLSCFIFLYFKFTKQYILSFRAENNGFKIFIFDKNFEIITNKNGEENFRYVSSCYAHNRESFIYSIEDNRYLLFFRY